jgi:6-pyruvoyltetrahydropterin/6-carboxytetrahydropterin synthase
MKSNITTFQSTKMIELGSCAFRQWTASFSHCRFVHGYQLKAKFWFEAKELDERNWVVDFGNLKELEKILKNQFDHTLCIAKDDPLLPSFKQLHDEGGCDLRIMDGVGIEKTAEWCFKRAQEHIQEITYGRCWVTQVEVWEHERNSAVYREEKSIY